MNVELIEGSEGIATVELGSLRLYDLFTVPGKQDVYMVFHQYFTSQLVKVVDVGANVVLRMSTTEQVVKVKSLKVTI